MKDADKECSEVLEHLREEIPEYTHVRSQVRNRQSEKVNAILNDMHINVLQIINLDINFLKYGIGLPNEINLCSTSITLAGHLDYFRFKIL